MNIFLTYVFSLYFLLLGHSPAEDYSANPDQNCLSVDDNETKEANSLPLSLKEQIAHKNKFLEDHISTHSRIILIGHSIGAYVILNLLKTCQRVSDITKAFLLFPTVERMAISPSGRYVTPFVTYFKWLAVASSAAFSILPAFVKEFLVRWWLNDRKRLSLSSVESILKLLTPQSIDGVFTMAQHEMKEVVDLDDEVPNHTKYIHCNNLIYYLLKPLTLKNCRLERISLNLIWVALSFKIFVFIAIDMKENTSYAEWSDTLWDIWGDQIFLDKRHCHQLVKEERP